MVRSGLNGPAGALTTGVAFGIPPIIKFGSRQLQERFLPDFLTGRKRICIAITEPEVRVVLCFLFWAFRLHVRCSADWERQAGSDVANIHTTAVKSEDGKHYIVNGSKKWRAVPPHIDIRNLPS